MEATRVESNNGTERVSFITARKEALRPLHYQDAKSDRKGSGGRDGSSEWMFESHDACRRRDDWKLRRFRNQGYHEYEVELSPLNHSNSEHLASTPVPIPISHLSISGCYLLTIPTRGDRRKV